MHELACWSRHCEHINWMLPSINFWDFEPLLRTDEVVYDVNMFSPLMIDLILG